MYQTYKKELGLGHEECAHGAKFKMTPKSMKIHENCGSQRNPADSTKIALAWSFFEQMTSNILYLKVIYVRAQILIQDQNIQISRYWIFPVGRLCGPLGQTKKEINSKTVLLCSLCPNLNFDPLFLPRFWKF